MAIAPSRNAHNACIQRVSHGDSVAKKPQRISSALQRRRRTEGHQKDIRLIMVRQDHQEGSAKGRGYRPTSWENMRLQLILLTSLYSTSHPRSYRSYTAAQAKHNSSFMVHPCPSMNPCSSPHAWSSSSCVSVSLSFKIFQTCSTW
jgi:hypothetical protein